MKIFVLFVEPMRYGLELIDEVYKKTEYEFLYVYTRNNKFSDDILGIPENSVILCGNDISKRRKLRELLVTFRPDFVVINGYVGNEQVATIRFCKKNRIKYAIESDTSLHIPNNKVKAFLKKIYLYFLLNNEYCYGFPGGTPQLENLVYYGISRDRCHIMPMSISNKRFQKEKALLPSKEELKQLLGVTNRYVFLYVGRLVEEKNVSTLIQAFYQLKKDRNDISLIIVGDGILKEKLTYIARDCSDIIFVGHKRFPEIVKYYAVADVFVLPSVYESWGLVVNEALAMDLPVIVSDKVGCGNDLVKKGINGYLFKYNSVDELASRMMKMIINYGNISKSVINNPMKWGFEYYRKQFEGFVEGKMNE